MKFKTDEELIEIIDEGGPRFKALIKEFLAEHQPKPDQITPDMALRQATVENQNRFDPSAN